MLLPAMSENDRTSELVGAEFPTVTLTAVLPPVMIRRDGGVAVMLPIVS